MATRRVPPHDALMTGDPPPAALAADRPVASRRLRRRTRDRVIGGVAAGVGGYLDVDPLLVRAVLAGLMIFGGAGLVLYVVAWLLIPAEGTDRSILAQALGRTGIRLGRALGAVIVFFAVVAGGMWLLRLEVVAFGRDMLLFALGLLVAGLALLRWGGARERGDAEPPPAGGPTWRGEDGPAAVLGAPAFTGDQAAPAPPRERSALGWLVLAAVLAAVATLAVAGSVSGARVLPGQYLGTVLAVVGLGLVVGAWWGRARLLVPVGVLLVPVAVVAAFLTVPLEGGVGDREFRPQTLGDLRPDYRLTGGDLRLDLGALSPAGATVSLAASVGVGRLTVVVPDGVPVEVEARVAGGGLVLFGARQTGTGLGDRVERTESGTGSASGRLTLELEVGIGGIVVETAPAGGG